MPTLESDFLRERVRATLVHHAGADPDARAVASATLRTWSQMADRLSPVIGARGVGALFERALLLTSKQYPCLARTGVHKTGDAFLGSLQAAIEACDRDAAVAATCVLLSTFTEHLATLIGESLTTRLMSPVWVRVSPPSDEEISS